jgi:cyclopropane fatty-acyl-phospholipid synthase-like methyltransferase
MEIAEIKKRFRRVDLEKYPQLRSLTRDQIYDGKMGPGGLILASEMSSKVPFQKGMRVMDLGCGKGGTSIFLAQTYGVTVYAIDLWISANELFKNIQTANCENKILPFNLDTTKDLPFPDGYFDVIFCMDALHYFGANPGFLAQISKYLKQSGYLVVGNPCFDREFETAVPKVYEAFWADEFSKYHSPKWWETLVKESRIFSDVLVEEARDGVIMWEDALLHDIETNNTKGGRLEADADEIAFGHDNPQYPYLTHYILSCRKK